MRITKNYYTFNNIKQNKYISNEDMTQNKIKKKENESKKTSNA